VKDRGASLIAREPRRVEVGTHDNLAQEGSPVPCAAAFGGRIGWLVVKWLVLVLGVLINATASILIKVSSLPPRKLPSFSTPIGEWIGNWTFWVGIVTYGIAFLTYVYALSLFPASIAYPIITAGAIAVVTLVAGLVLGESISALTIAGIIVVMGGVLMIALGSQR
jgi:small multidrug resistance pump